MVFRYILPLGVGIGDVASAILFGVFHLAVLGANFIGMATLIIMGMVWAFTRTRFGLMGAVGSHVAWNMMALGLMPLLFGGII